MIGTDAVSSGNLESDSGGKMAEDELAALEKERVALQKKLAKQEAELAKAMAAAKEAAKRTA